jgi:hypothetical protein
MEAKPLNSDQKKEMSELVTKFVTRYHITLCPKSKSIYIINRVVMKTYPTFYLIILLVDASSLVAYSQTGPGGVSSGTANLEQWLDSKRLNSDGSNPAIGSTVVTWYDKSGNGVNVTQNIANVASYTTNGVAFNNTGYLQGSDATFPSGNSARTVFICASTPTTPTDDVLFFYGTATNSQSYGILKLANGGVRNYFYNNDLDDTNGWLPQNQLKIVNTWYQTNSQQIFVDGTLSVSKTATPNTVLGSLQIGGWNSFSLFSESTIAEVIVYSMALNSAQRIIVNNYLAAKYNLTLSSSDIYTMDNVANGDFDYEVAGIGRVNASNIHNDAQGTSILRILSPSNLGNNEYLIWGHNNGALSATNSTDVPAGVQARYERVWRASETNAAGTAVDVGSVSIRWDLTGQGAVTANQLRLLVDTDNDGFFNDETPISGATALGSNVYQFAGVTAITNARRFTLATTDVTQTPLPVKLISFTASVSGYIVNLDWKTASEVNNDYFQIQRSTNGRDWQDLARVKGAGNSNESITYTTIDQLPYHGINYYRLKQVDFDGRYEYSIVESVSLNFYNALFPNPTVDNVILTSHRDDGNFNIDQIQVFSAAGIQVNDRVVIKILSSTQLEIDLSSLSAGIYLIKTKTGSLVVEKK